MCSSSPHFLWSPPPRLHLQGEPNHVTITAQFIPPSPAVVPLHPTGFLLRHPLHSASRLSLITDLTNGWKIQHQNLANLSVVIGMSEHNEDFEAPALGLEWHLSLGYMASGSWARMTPTNHTVAVYGLFLIAANSDDDPYPCCFPKASTRPE